MLSSTRNSQGTSLQSIDFICLSAFYATLICCSVQRKVAKERSGVVLVSAEVEPPIRAFTSDSLACLSHVLNSQSQVLAVREVKLMAIHSRMCRGWLGSGLR
jgi:hypothetical protein